MALIIVTQLFLQICRLNGDPVDDEVGKVQKQICVATLDLGFISDVHLTTSDNADVYSSTCGIKDLRDHCTECFESSHLGDTYAVMPAESNVKV